jgi:hypothetical protein
MANKRIKDLSDTATSMDAGDYLVVDAADDKTKKILWSNLSSGLGGGVTSSTSINFGNPAVDLSQDTTTVGWQIDFSSSEEDIVWMNPELNDQTYLLNNWPGDSVMNEYLGKYPLSIPYDPCTWEEWAPSWSSLATVGPNKYVILGQTGNLQMIAWRTSSKINVGYAITELYGGSHGFPTKLDGFAINTLGSAMPTGFGYDIFRNITHSFYNLSSGGGSGGSSTGAGEFLGRVDYFRASYPNVYTNNIGASLPSLSELIVPEGVINWGPANMEFKNVTNNTYVIEGVQYVAHGSAGELVYGSVEYLLYYKTLSLILAPQTQLTVFRPSVVSSMWSVYANGGINAMPKAGPQSWYIYKDGGKEHSIDYIKTFYGELTFSNTNVPVPPPSPPYGGAATIPSVYIEGTAI